MSYDRAFRREALSAYSWLAVYPEQYLARYLTLPPFHSVPWPSRVARTGAQPALVPQCQPLLPTTEV